MDDAADAGIVGHMLLVAAAVLFAGGLYLAASAPTGGEAPAALALVEDRPPATGTKGFTVASAQPGLLWGDVALSLDGAPLAYDATLATDATWCVAPAGSCAAEDADRLVAAGQQVRVHDAALAAKTLVARDKGANTILFQRTLTSP